MTLLEAKKLLIENNIAFEELEFENEKEFLQHIAMFPYTKKARSYKIISLVLKSDNGKKNIELQFNELNNIFYFNDLWFGDFDYEMFDYNEKMLAADLMHNITEIIKGNCIIITMTDMKHRRWCADARFDLSDGEEIEFQKAMKRIEKPKSFFAKLIKSKKQYEIYDWNTYRCIIK